MASTKAYLDFILEQLRELIEFGLIEKKSYEGYPLRVEYSVTERRGKK